MEEKMTTNIEFHELANIYPMMGVDAFDGLKADIAANGLHEPIWLLKDKILDGRNRYRACMELGIEPQFRTYTGTTPAQFVCSYNSARRDLTPSQRACVAVELLPHLEAEARERQRDGGGDKKSSDYKKSVNQKFDEPINGQSLDQAAKIVGTNRQYVSDAKRIRTENPEAFEKLKSGGASLQELKNETRIEQRKKDIELQIQSISLPTTKHPTGLFNVIVLDPPWPYGTSESYNPANRRGSCPYPEMPLAAIGQLNLPAADDCVLWLWTTHKFMRDSFTLLDGWGFKDKMIVTWVKDRMGLGSWLRSQSEFCIMAVRGRPVISLTNQTTVLNGKMREHSRKPDEFYRMVDSLCHGRKLDFFSREHRDGWAQYGNDPEKFSKGVQNETFSSKA